MSDGDFQIPESDKVKVMSLSEMIKYLISKYNNDQDLGKEVRRFVKENV